MTDWRALEEADNRGLLPDHLKGALYEAQRRGLTGPTKGAARAQGKDLPMGERFFQGIKDIGAGAAQLYAHVFPSQLPHGMTVEDVDQKIAAGMADYAQRREEIGGGGGLPDFARTGGNVTAMLPAAALAPTAQTIAGGAALGALGGAAASALAPVEDPNANFMKEKFGQMGAGAVAGGLTGGIGTGFAKAIAPKPSAEVKQLMSKGVTPTAGQILGGAAGKFEEKLASVPLLGDAINAARRRSMEQFNVAAFNDVLAPIGKTASGKVGRDGIQEIEQTISNEYERILPKVTFRADQELVDGVASLRELASFMPEEQFRQFEKVLQQKIGPRLGESGTMDGRTFQNLDSELGSIAKSYRTAADPDKRELGAAIFELQSMMRENLERANPMYAPQLGAAREAYKRFIRVQRAATYTGGDPGVFSPEQFLAAVKAMDSSVRKGAVARGDASMQGLADAGKTVLGGKVPDSGTAGRLLAVAAGGGMVEPTSLALSGALTLPYTQFGQRLMASALTKRPPGSDLAAEILRRGLVPAAAGAGLVNQ